jgi:hypothetical protein
MKKPTFRINVTGDWCNGYSWQLIGTKTNKVLKESGPYHNIGRDVVWSDAVDYANLFHLDIESDTNPFK